jgi:hypothetical protein
MDEGILRVGADETRSEPGTLDVGQFARSIRRLASEVHEILNRPDATTGELTELRRRFKELLRVARGSGLTEIERWLRSANRTLDARLLSGLVVELGLTVN